MSKKNQTIICFSGLLLLFGLIWWGAMPAFTSPISAQIENDNQAILMTLINQARWENGQLPPLKRNVLLDNSAATHSSNMAERNFFSHCDVDTGTLPGDRMLAAGYAFNWWGENYGVGFTTPEIMFDWWMNSPPHRANILSTNIRELGIGYVFQSFDTNNLRSDFDSNCVVDGVGYGPYYHYWVLNFGKINSQFPVVANREAISTTQQTVNLFLYGNEWAQEMRIRNDGGEWSDWEPFASDRDWVLDAGNGLKTVHIELKNGATVYSATDTIELGGNWPPSPTITPTSTPNINVTPWVYLPAIMNENDENAGISPAPKSTPQASSISIIENR